MLCYFLGVYKGGWSGVRAAVQWACGKPAIGAIGGNRPVSSFWLRSAIGGHGGTRDATGPYTRPRPTVASQGKKASLVNKTKQSAVATLYVGAANFSRRPIRARRAQLVEQRAPVGLRRLIAIE